MRPVLPLLLLITCISFSCRLSAQIISGNCFIQGKYVELGIGPCGTFGTSIDAPPGYHPRGATSGPNVLKLGFIADQGKDGWDIGTSGKPNYCGDYYVPGTPEEGWGITMNGINYNNNLLCTLNEMPGSVMEYRNNGTIISGTWEGKINGLSVSAKTMVPIDKLYFLTEVTLKNTTTDTIRNLYYMRNIDPDNEVTLTMDYSTNNTILNQNPNIDNKAVVTAQGKVFGCFIALGTRDCRAKVSYGGFTNRSAANAWNGLMPHTNVPGTQTGDIAITISFSLGDLAPGQQTSLKFVNVLNLADLDEAVDLTGPSFLIGNTEEIISSDTAQICATGPTTFEVINTGGFDNWTWSPATGLNTSTGPLVICNGNIDTLNYVATGTNNCGGSISINFTAIKGIVTHVPKAGPISGPTNFCLPDITATYTLADVPRAKKYKWKVPAGASILSGDGTNSVVVKMPDKVTYDSISVYGTNVCGGGDTSQLIVTVCDCNKIYPVSPTASSICPGDSVQLTTSFLSGASYQWYKNAIPLPGLTGPTIFAKDSGTYEVQIYPNNFCVNKSSKTRIDFTYPPVITLSPTGKIYKCEGTSVSIAANVIPNAPGIVIYDWYKDGILFAPKGPAVLTVTDDGIYSVKVTNSNQCKSVSQNDTVISYKRPVLIGYGFEGEPTTCLARMNTFKAVYDSPDGGVTAYQWYKDGNAISGATNPLLTVGTSGLYGVQLTSSHGCTNIMRDTSLIFYPVPLAGFENPDGCIDGNFNFLDLSSVASGAISKWTWEKNGTVFSNTQNPNIDFSPGTYQIRLTVQSDKGCVSEPIEQSFLRYGKPSARFEVDATCADSLSQFTSISLDAGYGNTSISSWTWDFGNGVTSDLPNPSLVYDIAGYYTVKLSFHGNNCENVQDSSIRKIYLADPLPAMRYNNVVALENEKFFLYGGRDGVSYNWSPTIGLSNPLAKNPNGVLSQSQLYTVHVINSNGCGRVDTVLVSILKDCKIYVPNAFTPNNDGKNDKLRIYFGCLKTLTHFTIYNRWGQKLFSTQNGTQSWDGKYNGVDQPIGTYIWVVEGQYNSGEKFSEKGTFTLVR